MPGTKATPLGEAEPAALIVSRGTRLQDLRVPERRSVAFRLTDRRPTAR